MGIDENRRVPDAADCQAKPVVAQEQAVNIWFGREVAFANPLVAGSGAAA
jgi:hypothetical protein